MQTNHKNPPKQQKLYKKVLWFLEWELFPPNDIPVMIMVMMWVDNPGRWGSDHLSWPQLFPSNRGKYESQLIDLDFPGLEKHFHICTKKYKKFCMQIPPFLPGLWCTAWKLRRRRKVKIPVGRKHVWNTPMNADADNERPAEILKIWDGRLSWVRQVRPVQQFDWNFCRIPILVQIWANLFVDFLFLLFLQIVWSEVQVWLIAQPQRILLQRVKPSLR